MRASKIDKQFLEFLQGFNPPDIMIHLFRIIIKKLFDSEWADYAVAQHQITKNLEYLFNRSIKAKELFLRGEIDGEDFNVIKSDCEAKINSMSKDLQQVALNIVGSQNNINEVTSQLFHIDQLFLKLPFERKVKMAKLLLKDKIVPDDNTFQNALNDVASIAVGTEVLTVRKTQKIQNH